MGLPAELRCGGACGGDRTGAGAANIDELVRL
jgi:hypothetical protein